jgi:hypothetical protein
MGMNPRLLRPILSGDPDALRYIAAVQQADQQSLEPAVRKAITDFVVGCKADGIWDALKACCILAGARTLSGALVPLKGAAPTNNNFVSGDYDRKTGLVGDGTTKYLNSNRNNNADPQNSKHISVYASNAGTGGITIGCGTGSDTGRSAIVRFFGAPSNNFACRLNTGTASAFGNPADIGFAGLSRSESGTYTARVSGSNNTAAVSSQTPQNENIGVLARATGAAFAADRLAFYSIGESLDLALLDTRVTALYNAIGAAI